MQISGNVSSTGISGALNFEGAGSEISIDPILLSGYKIADYTIDGVTDSLYCLPASEVEVTPAIFAGTKIATITIDGDDFDIYAPSAAALTYVDETIAAYGRTEIGYLTDGGQQTQPINIPTPSYVDLTGGQGTQVGGFSFDGQVSPVFVPSSGIINYSTTEQLTGQKWIDGKDIYVRVISVDNLAADTNSDALQSNVDFYFCGGITVFGPNNTSWSPSTISMYNYQGVGTYYANVYKDINNDIHISNLSRQNAVSAIAIIYYTKVV